MYSILWTVKNKDPSSPRSVIAGTGESRLVDRLAHAEYRACDVKSQDPAEAVVRSTYTGNSAMTLMDSNICQVVK